MAALPVLTAKLRTLLWAMLLPIALVACDSLEERVQKHYEDGLELMEAEEYRKASLEFRNALKLNAEHAPSHFELGKIFEQENALQEALSRYLRVKELDAEHVEARLKLTRFFILGNRIDDAREELASIEELSPNLPETYVLRAAVEMKDGNNETARELIDQAKQVSPDDPEVAVVDVNLLFQNDDLVEALVRANAALEQHPEHVALHLAKLQLQRNLSNDVGVRDQLQTMIETFPDKLQFRQALIQWALEHEDMELAETNLRAVQEALPEERAALMNLIRFIRTERGDFAAREEIVAQIEKTDNPLEMKLLLAQYDLELGDKERAIETLQNLISEGGKEANVARVRLARLYYEDGSVDEADALVAETLELEPTDVDALAILGARQIDRDELEQAIQTIRAGLAEAPSDTRLLLLAGRTQELLGNLDLANDRLASAVNSADFNPETVRRYVQFLVRIERFTAAETVLSEAIQRQPQDVELLDMLGFTRLRLQDWLGAQEAAQALRAVDPERSRQLQAAILLGQERFDEGASILRAELPEDARRRAASVTALLQAYVRDGKVEEAEQFLEDLLAEDPESIQALGLRGNLYLAQGEQERAEELFRRILEIDPANGSAHSALARVRSAVGDQEGAESIILSGLDLAPENLVLLSRLAQLRQAQNRYDDAIEIYERLYRRVPDSLLVANNLASLLSDQRPDDPVAVERAYTIASRLRPSDIPQYRDTYGWTRYLKGEYREALSRIKPVAEALPNNPWIRYHLGMVYLALEDVANAEAELNEALRLAGDAVFRPREEIQQALADLAAN